MNKLRSKCCGAEITAECMTPNTISCDPDNPWWGWKVTCNKCHKPTEVKEIKEEK